MKVELKLAFNNIKKNFKRTIFTTISVILCTFLILTTILVISSISNGILENIATEYNDYSFIIKNLSIQDLNKIKNKEYIDKIYVQKSDNENLQKLEELPSLSDFSSLNIYIKYNNIKDTYTCSSDIVQTLGLSVFDASEKCEFNENLLPVFGLMGARLTYADSTKTILVYKSTLNFSYVLDLLIFVILLFFSILFIIILYNAFLITLNERRKEYAILNSIGGTENQILKIVFLEATIIGIFGIIFGAIFSFFGTSIVLEMVNNVLSSTPYHFKLIIDINYLLVSLLVIVFNIYISAIIPSLKASNTSVIQDIRNSKQIKYKKKFSILEKIFPIEGKIALKNLSRNNNKYRVITFLLVISMISFIAISTYINYEKEASDLVTVYDVDAELSIPLTSNTDYKSLLNNYIANSENHLEYIEYTYILPYALVEPPDALIEHDDILITISKNNQKATHICIIGLDNNSYSKYINELHANLGDFIIYNTASSYDFDNSIYNYFQVFNTNYNLNLSLIGSEQDMFKIYDDENLKGHFVFTDEPLDGFKELKTTGLSNSVVFVPMNTFNNITKTFNSLEKNSVYSWGSTSANYVKIKCDNIIDFSNYINENKTMDINVEYYSLDNQVKIVYTNILELLLVIIIFVVVIIGIISSINIINASLCERVQEFKVLSLSGATKTNIFRILIYECVYMFIKATFISVVLSIPILYAIIHYMESIIVLNKLLIPFGWISLFIISLFAISLFITIYSARFIKDD